VSRLALLLLIGCGRLSFDPLSGGAAIDDANGDGAMIIDAAIDAPPGSMVVTFGEASVADVSGVTIDTILDAASVVGNYGGRPTLDLDSRYTPLLRFNVTSIPSTATVLDARLTLYTTGDATTNTVTAHRLLEAWTEGTQNGPAGAANFLERQMSVAWLNSGATGLSRSSGMSGAFQPMAADSAYTFVLTTALVQLWVDDGGENKGIVLALSAGDTVVFHSSESSIGDRRPLLRVTYMPQ
jgi:hypothetical protein